MKNWTEAEKKKAIKMFEEGSSFVDITWVLPNKTYGQVRYFFLKRMEEKTAEQHRELFNQLSAKKGQKIEWNDYKKYGGLPMQQQPKKKSSTQDKIIKTMDEIKDFLVQKNNQYGDSVFQPVRVFSKADKTEQIKVRIDDKLSRLKRGNDSIESDEDVVSDLIGYLVLLLISMRE